MAERLYTLLMALLAAAFLIVVMVPPQDNGPPQSLPHTLDRRGNGLAVAYAWLQQQGVAVYSLQQRYDALLDEKTLPTSGNLLVTVMNHRSTVQLKEANALKTWLQQGNQLLILWHQEPIPKRNEEVSGDPVYLQSPQEQFFDDLGLNMGYLSVSTKQDHVLSTPTMDHPVLRGVRRIQGTMNPVNDLLLNARDKDFAIQLDLLRNDKGQATLWLRNLHGSRVWFLMQEGIFSNDGILKADNARLLFNLADYNLSGQGRVIFDDFHQGVSALYDAHTFYADPRLHHSLWFIALLWVIYLVGHSRRFILQASRDERPTLMSYVNNVASLFVRRLSKAANGRRLLFHFNNEVRAYSGLPQNGQSVFQLLGRNRQLQPQLLQQLQTFQQRIDNGQSVNLLRLSQCLQQIRKGLL